MTLNYPYPAVAKMFYEYDGVQHVHNIGVKPSSGFDTLPSGMDADSYELSAHDAVTVYTFQEWVDRYINGFTWNVIENIEGMLKRFGDDTTIQRVELWRYGTQSLQGQFMASVDVGLAGTALQPTIALLQRTYTFRSAEGGVSRAVLMECASGDSTGQATSSSLGNAELRWVQMQFIHQSSPVIAKDTSRLVSFIKRSNGQNEALFRKRFR